jgi:UDP:flavonoid glycosyltransferase YjiC (YdhE family)
LARRLREQGHRTVFFSMAGAERLVRANGFEFAVFDGEMPFCEFVAYCGDGRLDERIRSVGADLVVCDTMLWYVAFRAMHMGIPVVNVTVPVTGWAGAGVPPAVSGRMPGQGVVEPWRVRAEWAVLRARNFFTKRLAARMFGSYRAPTRLHHLEETFFALARRAGVRLREGETWRYTEYGPQLLVPEIVMGPKALGYPLERHGERCYVGDFPDAERAEETGLLEALDGERPLVYCSLGTAVGMYRRAGRYFAAVREASRLRRDWQWVVAGDGEGREGNLWAMQWAPQLALLRRAAVMVTHGGIGSMMECIRYEVPMVIVPGARDQPGNRARAVYHGIAVGAEMATLTGEILAKKVSEAMGDAGLRERLARMRERVEGENGLDEAVRLIERVSGRCG